MEHSNISKLNSQINCNVGKVQNKEMALNEARNIQVSAYLPYSNQGSTAFLQIIIFAASRKSDKNIKWIKGPKQELTSGRKPIKNPNI